MLTNVVIIDDETGILEAIKIILSQEGMQVDTHSSLPDISLIERSKPNIILLDIQLGSEKGSPFCKTLKNNKSTKDIPIVLLSAHSETDVENVAREVGADGLLTKPFDIDALLSKIREFV